MSDVAIMLAETKDDSRVPEILLADGGLWSETIKPASLTLEASHARFSREVRNAVVRAEDEAGSIEHLAGIAQSLFYDIVGRDLEEALRSALAEADAEAARTETEFKPPLLTIHLYPRDEWIPWELLNDGKDFLGLRFRIARMPILPSPYRRVPPAHPLRMVRSVLGRRVAEPADEDFQAWRDTFRELLPDSAQTELVPPVDAPEGWPTVIDLQREADILHITCHGKAEEGRPPVWTLDPDAEMPDRYEFDRALLGALRRHFSRRPPLVFANACSEAPTGLPPAQPPLANEMVSVGAVNFVGTLAPVRRRLAIRFARRFFEGLLREGRDVGAALYAAKRACYEDPSARDDPTYLLYTLYGPPGTRFAPTNGEA